jgi:two-component system, OmpR family, phosphate regulon response regulator PhoB
MESPMQPCADRPTSQPTVLVVEDDPAIQELLAELLSMEGYRVAQARDGETGLDLARRTAPDAVLLDLAVPPTSGFDVLERLRGEDGTRHIPVVIVSGQAVPTWPEGSSRPDRFIAKPFDVDDVLLNLQQVMTVREPQTPDPTVTGILT